MEIILGGFTKNFLCHIIDLPHPHCGFFSKIIYFIYLKELQMEKQGESCSICWLNFPKGHNGQSCAILNPRARDLFQELEHVGELLLFPSTLAGNWIWIEATRSWIGPKWDTGSTGGSLMCYITTPAPRVIIFFVTNRYRVSTKRVLWGRHWDLEKMICTFLNGRTHQGRFLYSSLRRWKSKGLTYN